MKRENRYWVAKIKDVQKYLAPKEIQTLIDILDKLDAGRASDNKISLRCVVVESDWDEYEAVWKAIESRVNSEEN